MIELGDIYDKDVNFLFGSGASYGLLPTLALGIRNDDTGQSWSLEDLATHIGTETDARYCALFMHYYLRCIWPAQNMTLNAINGETELAVIENYKEFLRTVLAMLQRRSGRNKSCNLFTTNYDGCFPLVADQLLHNGEIDFQINDGTRGFSKKLLHVSNFNTHLVKTGVFDQHERSIPQVNLIHLHGSVYWGKEGRDIFVDYAARPHNCLLADTTITKLVNFSDTLLSPASTFNDLPSPDLTQEEIAEFFIGYNNIPIVNPTKWKFHETVYEEHYYQMLRYMSYELEKKNAVLITFGFSFADEHILNLIKRSLSNPHLKVFVCCYSEETRLRLSAEFSKYENVECIALEDGSALDFRAFNQKVLCRTQAIQGKAAPAPINGTPQAAPIDPAQAA